MYRAMKYALDRRGEIKSITEVRNGLACDCICPDCKRELVAKNNGLVKEHHFAHFSGTECAHGYETSLHLFAKKIFQDAKRIRVPSAPSAISFKNSNLVDVQEYTITNVQVETIYENYVPDIILELANGSHLNIEIFVTHQVDFEKRDKIIHSQRDTIEIDLSQFDRDISDEELRQILLTSTKEKSWVYYHKYEKLMHILKTYGHEKTITKCGSFCELCPKKTNDFYAKSKCLTPLNDCEICDFNLNKDNHDLLNTNRIICIGHFREIENVFPDQFTHYFDQPAFKEEYFKIADNHAIELHTLQDLWRKSDKKLPMYLLNHQTNKIFRLVKKPLIEFYEHIQIYGEYFDGYLYKEVEILYADKKQWSIHPKIEC